MGKKKDNKEKKVRLPKEVAGVKVPKALRKKGEQLADLARNPLVAEIAAVGLTAVAAALRESAKVKAAGAKASEAAATAEKHVAETVKEAVKEAKPAFADIANLALAAATQGIQAFANAAREKAEEAKRNGETAH